MENSKSGVKLLQFMSTHRKINAIFQGQGYHCLEEAFPIVGLVLLEDKSGEREIIPAYLNKEGIICYLRPGIEGFIEIRPESKGVKEYRESDRML